MTALGRKSPLGGHGWISSPLVAGSTSAMQRANLFGPLCSATVDLNLISPRAIDQCGCILSRDAGLGVFDGVRSDGRALDDPYPEGCTTIATCKGPSASQVRESRIEGSRSARA